MRWLEAIQHTNGILAVQPPSKDARDEEVTQLRGPVYASLVAGDGKLYCTSARGVIAVLKLGAEFSVLSTNDLSEHFGGQRVLATPALAPGAVFVRSEGRLSCFRV